MSYESPASILFDINGIAMAVSGGIAVPVSTSGLISTGMTNTGTASYIRTELDGTQWITGSVASSFAGITNVSGALPVFITASNPITVNQGTSGSQAQSWFVKISDGTNVLGTGSSSPFWITGSVSTTFSGLTTVTGTVGIAGNNQGSPLFITFATNATSTVVSRSQTNSSIVILSASTTTKETIIYNDASVNLFLRFGSAAASSTDFTHKMTGQSYYEVPGSYTGQITGVWASNGTGFARTTEISP